MPDDVLTKADLRLAHALLSRSQFTYEDLSLATGYSVSAVKRRLSGRWGAKGLYPFADTGARVKGASGPPRKILTLSDEITARLKAMVEQAAPDAPEFTLEPEDLPQIERLDTFLEDIQGEDNLIFQTRQLAIAQDDFSNLGAQLSEDGIVVIRPSDAVLARMESLGSYVERTAAVVARKAAARAEKISRQAAVMARNVESPERLLGQMEPLIEDAQSTRDPIDLLVMLVCSAGLERRRGAFDHNMVELVTELHAVDLVTQAIAVSRELAASLPTWRGLATKAFGGAFKSDLCTLEPIRLEAQVSFRAAPASARERYLAYAPAGTIAEELGSHWGPLVAQEEDTSGAADETSTLVGMGIKSQSKELIDAAARRLGLQEPALG